MAQRFRIPAGGRIDRTRTVAFHWNGERLEGYAGDTLASALLANGHHLVGRSFKYHRPRGILTAGSEEPNALVQLETGARTLPNMRATQVELYPGLKATAQNCWPSLAFDVGAINNTFSRLIPSGFYYKTFMAPASWWETVYEPRIRRAAGFGHAPRQPDPDRYEKTHVHCEVLVVGAGPAGLAAALAAGRSGARVMLVDEQNELGGSLLSRNETISGKPGAEWLRRALAELETLPEVRLLPRTTLFSYFDHNYLAALERVTDHLGPDRGEGKPRQRLWKIRARQVVLATGAHERPLVFRNNDRPGVMLASAARTYANRYAVRPGERAVVFTNNDDAWGAALDLSDAGLHVSIVDSRAEVDETLRAAAEAREMRTFLGQAVLEAHGGNRVRGVRVGALDESGRSVRGTPRDLRCDVVAMSGGWNPAVHLLSQSRGKLDWDERQACFVPGTPVQAERSVGACNGSFDLAACLREGHAAGREAAAAAGFRAPAGRAPSAEVREQGPLRPLWVVPPARVDGPTNKHFVDFQHDVTAADVGLAAREGYVSVEHLKRYTTTGMGTDQGKTSNVNALAILAQTLGEPVPAVGTTTFRPPYTPVTFGALAGRDIDDIADPVRMTAMHWWHVEHGARFEDVGQWKRPWYYPHGDEDMHAAVARECKAVRNAVGILDASTLGKIDIQGPDAGEFLDRIYTNGFRKLAIGRARYGLMCGEDGMVFDDGVSVRMGENHYLMHTTTGGAARVLAWLESWLQTEWPTLRVYCNSVTEQWATASISGPKARALLGELCSDVDLSPEAFPFMSLREGTVAGIAARINRVSFTGESSFEINVPAHYGLALWQALMHAGVKYGITPFGTETMHVLRAEKGFIIVGQDTDGTLNPYDLGLGGMVAKHKDFLGKRSMLRADSRRPDRKHLVGLRTENPTDVLPEGGQIVETPQQQPPVPMLGHVTSSYWSENLGHSIAMGLVKGGQQRLGGTVYVQLAERAVKCTVVQPQFYDPQGSRMHG